MEGQIEGEPGEAPCIGPQPAESQEKEGERQGEHRGSGRERQGEESKHAKRKKKKKKAKANQCITPQMVGKLVTDWILARQNENVALLKCMQSERISLPTQECDYFLGVNAKVATFFSDIKSNGGNPQTQETIDIAFELGKVRGRLKEKVRKTVADKLGMRVVLEENLDICKATPRLDPVK